MSNRIDKTIAEATIEADNARAERIRRQAEQTAFARLIQEMDAADRRRLDERRRERPGRRR